MSYSLVNSSLYRYTDVYIVIECVQLCVHTFFVNNFSTPSSFIHKWFGGKKYTTQAVRLFLTWSVAYIRYTRGTNSYRLYSLYFLSFKTTLKFNHTWDFSHYRRSPIHTTPTYGGVQTMTSNNRSNWYKLTFYSYFNQYDSFHVMNILDGDAVWEIDMERTT